MATDVERLVVRLEASATKFEREMQKATGTARKASRDIESSLSGMVGRVNASLGAIGVGVSFAAVGAFVKNAVSSLDEIGDTAERINVTTDFLQAMRYELKLVGVDADAAEAGFRKFADATVQAGVSETELTRILNANNVALKNKDGSLRSTSDLLREYAVLIANAGSHQEKVRLATEAFGKSGFKLISVLEQIAAQGYDPFIAKAKEAGVVVEGSLIKSADEIERRWTAMFDSLVLGLKATAVTAADQFGALYDTVRVGTGIAENAAKNELTKKLNAGQFSKDFGFDPFAPKPKTKTVLPLGGGGGGAAKESEYQREINNVKKRIEQATIEAQTIGLTEAASAKLKTTLELENAAREAGGKITAAQTREISVLAEAYSKQIAAQEAARETQDKLKQAQEDALEFQRFAGQSISGFFSDIISGGENAEKALSNLIKKLADAALQAALLGDGPLASIFGTQSSTSGGVGGLIGSIFGGFRAGGGNVSSSKAYVVGEKGPELFMPNANGAIIPNKSLGGGVNVQINPVFNNADAGVEARIKAQLRSEIPALAVQAVVRANRDKMVSFK